MRVGVSRLKTQRNYFVALKEQGRHRCRPRIRFPILENLNVLSLPALGSLGDVELHRLAFLEASEATGLDGGEMHENVFAILTADKAVAFGVIEPLYCSLFHIELYSCSFDVVTLEGFGRKLAQVTGC